MPDVKHGNLTLEQLHEAVLFTLKRGGQVRIAPSATPGGGAPAGGGAVPPPPVSGAGQPATASGTVQLMSSAWSEEVRGLLAMWAFGILTILVVAVLIAVASGKVSVSDLTSLIQAIFAGTSGIIGAIIGFYFSGQQTKTSQTSP